MSTGTGAKLRSSWGVRQPGLRRGDLLVNRGGTNPSDAAGATIFSAWWFDDTNIIVTPGVITATATVRAPTPTVIVTAGVLTAAATVRAPLNVVIATPGVITSTATVQSPTPTVIVTAEVVTATATVQTATATEVGGGVVHTQHLGIGGGTPIYTFIA